MKTTTLYILLVIAVLLLGAYTRNHGDIGPWFGTWQVESITAGDPVVHVNGDYFFQFQSQVFRVLWVGDHEQTVESYGTWRESDDGKMTVTFPDPNVFYIVMPGLEDYNDFSVGHVSSSEVTLDKTDTTGIAYRYHLKKLI